MMRRLGVFGSAGSLLASVFIAIGMSAAHAASFEDWASVSGGGSHSCGIRHGGKLYCWGRDVEGEVGDGGANENAITTPRRVGTFEDWATVSAGGSHNCGVRRNGKLYCWGWDFYGQIGDGDGTTATPVSAPERIGTFEDWATVSAGGQHTCGVRKNGKLYCWGSDSQGQVGDGDATAATAPRRIGTFEDWANAAAGIAHTCGVRRNGKLYCWGSDNHGQIGDGDAPGTATSPRRIGIFEDWANAAAGNAHTCGVRSTGKLYCWGSDSSGQVGNGSTTGDVISPQRIGTFEDWANASAAFAHTCGVRTNGKLYCWGNDSNGQVGDGDPLATVTAPQRI
jgi:alpha-tubulin suppressor-like RCC1 family protein